MLAEEAGLARPYQIQSLLGQSSWSADALCERVWSYVFEAPGDPDGVLVVDETRFLKKGTQSVGVARQYSGTAGRIENCQIGVFASYVSRWGHALTDPATLIAGLPPEDWQALSAGEGTKGYRLYDWAWVPLNYIAGEGFFRWLLARRSLRHPEAISYYIAYTRTNATLPELAAAAGLRWTIEECFLRAKGDLGLDHCEARSWHGWHRHMSLVMAASALLVRLSANQRQTAFSKPNKTKPQNQPEVA